jgi:hypothetical protein
MSEIFGREVAHLNDVIEECENYLFITRDTDLQKQALEKLRESQARASEQKQVAINSSDNDFSNLFLGFECVFNCLASELMMWINLKEGNPDQAWDNLVSAQNSAVASVRAHSGFSHNRAHVQRLEEIEKIVFPPQVFVSAGLIVNKQECSICGVEYGECDHLAGRPYGGRFCSIIARDFTANHVAVVRVPADKRCRITNFRTAEGTRNRLTWKIDPPQGEVDASIGSACETSLTCSGVILTTGR